MSGRFVSVPLSCHPLSLCYWDCCRPQTSARGASIPAAPRAPRPRPAGKAQPPGVIAASAQRQLHCRISWPVPGAPDDITTQASSPPPLQALDSLLGDFRGALQAAGGQSVCFTSDFFFYDYNTEFQLGDSSIRWASLIIALLRQDNHQLGPALHALGGKCGEPHMSSTWC